MKESLYLLWKYEGVFDDQDIVLLHQSQGVINLCLKYVEIVNIKTERHWTPLIMLNTDTYFKSYILYCNEEIIYTYSNSIGGHYDSSGWGFIHTKPPLGIYHPNSNWRISPERYSIISHIVIHTSLTVGFPLSHMWPPKKILPL